ncbi:unnamed protein product [Merluccius merluccius]
MGTAPTKLATAEPVKTTLFERSSGGFTYRIPSLVYLRRGKRYLAFAEKRTSSSDHDAKCLVIRRGTTADDGSVKWSPCEELSTAQLPHHRTMNPCPVYDSDTQTLFLFFICVQSHVTERHQILTRHNQTRLCLVTSRDHGDTWSEAEDLTESTLGRWATFAVGPGHGIPLAAGRLVVPAYAYYKHVCHCFFRIMVQQQALSIYSDDAGHTWRIGELLGAESGECEMAEVIESSVRYLYCNARRKGTRLEALSCDSGEHFEEPYSGARLVEPGDGCQGSVISFPALMPSESVPTWLAFSHPTNKRERLDLGVVISFPAPVPSESVSTWLAFSHPTNEQKRQDLGVYLNRTPMSKSTWEPPMVINKGPSGYSDLAYNQDDHIFSCLLECGKDSEVEQIAFSSFTLAEWPSQMLRQLFPEICNNHPDVKHQTPQQAPEIMGQDGVFHTPWFPRDPLTTTPRKPS